jgi:arsenate reductase
MPCASSAAIVRSMSLRIALCSLAMAFGAHTPAQDLAASSPHESPRVVFVCEHGSVKSLIAMEYFNRRVQERGLAYRAVARGTAPEPIVPSSVRDGLRTAGFDVSHIVPRLFEVSDVEDASLVVSFDQDIAKIVDGKARHLAWDDLPGVLADYARGRDEIVRHVDALVDDLARSAAP